MRIRRTLHTPPEWVRRAARNARGESPRVAGNWTSGALRPPNSTAGDDHELARTSAPLGDEDWKSLLDRHDAKIRAIVGRAGGSVVKTTGDGVLALLPSAGGSMIVAAAILRELRSDGLDARIGVHVGDIDRRGDDVSGLAVNIASRAMSQAGAGKIVVTASVVASVAGQVVAFESLGEHDLKGVPGAWELFRLTGDA